MNLSARIPSNQLAVVETVFRRHVSISFAKFCLCLRYNYAVRNAPVYVEDFDEMRD